MENLGGDDVDDGTIRNAGSLSLELFEAKATGDRLISSVRDDERRIPSRLEGIFEDKLSAENIFRRDWRETRLQAHADIRANERDIGEVTDEVGSLPVFGAQKPGSRKVSPASSVRSRGSASSTRRSPSNRTSVSTRDGIGEPDVVSYSVGGRKRKVSVDDDEVEIVEGVVPANPKKLKAKHKPKKR